MKTVIKIPDPQGEYAPLVYKISNLEIRHTVLGECDISNSTSKIIVIKTSEENLLGTIITDNLLLKP